MKHSNIVFVFILLIISSCCKTTANYQLPSGELKDVVFLCRNDNDTKIQYIESEAKALWERSDMIGVTAYFNNTATDKNFQPFVTKTDDVSNLYLNTVKFQGKLTDMGEGEYTFYGVSPYTSWIASDTNVKVRLPEIQNPKSDSWDSSCDIMVSKPITHYCSSVSSSESILSFRRLVGILELELGTSILDKVGNENIEAIKIESSGSVLSGSFNVDLTKAIPSFSLEGIELEEQNNSVVLDYKGLCLPLKDVKPYFVLNPVNNASVVLTIKTSCHTITCNRSNLTISSGTITHIKLNWKDGTDVIASSAPFIPSKPDSLRVLTFGHSLVLNSLGFMPSMLHSANLQNVRFGAMYNGNWSIQGYLKSAYSPNNTIGGTETYDYYEYYYDGAETATKTTKTIIDVMTERKWDIIVLQTDVYKEGFYDSFSEALGGMCHYVDSVSVKHYGSHPILAWHMFWTSTTDWRGLVQYYENNMDVNYASHVQATKEILNNTNVSIVIPTGTTLQSMRHSKYDTPTHFSADSLHLDNTGRYAACCTWFETFIKPSYGLSALDNSFTPALMTMPVEKMKRAAVEACKKPFEISFIDDLTPITINTDIQDYQEVAAEEQKQNQDYQEKSEKEL